MLNLLKPRSSQVLRSSKPAITVPSRQFFGKLFGSSSKCQSVEPVFRAFQTKVEDELGNLEKTFDKGSLNHLLTTFYKCQLVGIRDKFFYDTLIEKVASQMSRLVTARDMVALGAALSANPDFQRDHADFIKDFYTHVYKHRFLLQAEDKKALNTIFTQMNAVSLFTRHLDLFQDIKRKDVSVATQALFGIQLPDDVFRVDFDFQNSVVILQNKETGQTIVVHGSQHHVESSINFGQQLIETFKPKSILVEDGPLMEQIRPEYKTDDGQVIPADYALTETISGQLFNEFVRNMVEQNQGAYEVDQKRKIVLKRFADGLVEPQDMASYAYFLAERLRKTQSIESDTKMVFADLTSQEIATSFIRYTDLNMRAQLRDEIRFGSLLETASWMAQNYKQGCVKCAPFLARTMMKQYPDRPIQFLNSEQIPSFAVREKNMAYQILKLAVENPQETHFVAYVGKAHLMKVACQLSEFLNNPQAYQAYERPPSVISEAEIGEDPDSVIKNEFVKTFAMASSVYEDDLTGTGQLPFKYRQEHLDLLKEEEREMQGDVAMVSFFKDVSDFNLDLQPSDFVSGDILQKQLAMESGDSADLQAFI